jgi:adenylate cyclase
MGKGKRVRHWKYWSVLGGIAVASLPTTWLLGQTAYVQLLHLKARDLHFLLRGARPTPDITLVTIDQHALDTFREPLLFWHPYYADAIRAAAAGGAKVLGLDVTFAIPVQDWAPDLDQKLVEAVIENAPRMPVICAYIQGTLNLQQERPVPLNMLAASLGLGALANVGVDRDDFVRQVELVEPAQPGSEYIPVRGLAMRIAEAFTGAQTRITGGQAYLGDRVIPTVAPRTMIINFAGPAGTFPRVSLSDFVLAYRGGQIERLRNWVSGKVVLLGMDNVEDRHATPFYVLSKGRRANTAGVEVQASAVDTLIHRQFLVDVPLWARWLGLIVTAAVTALAAGSLVGWRLASVLGGGVLLAVGAAHMLFQEGWLLSDSELALEALLSAGPVLAYRSLSAERRGSLFQRAVAVFVGGGVAETLDRTETIARSGKRQNVTILFSDIRGFTAFCEEKDPAVVVDLLNRYMETMVSLIVKHGGQVNKFIGDGIMAIFSDEDAAVEGTHGERAVRCGVEMARVPGQFKTGVGIHSGVVVVGVVGSSDKMEYTALGDTVNLASRLESLNKEHKTQLLLSDETRQMLSADMETVCLGEVQVRGKTVPMKIHTAAELRPAAAAAAG